MSGEANSKYKPEYDEQAYKLCLLGFIDKQLAGFFEVSVATIHNWKNDHPSFLDSIKKAKEIADGDIAQSLYKRAFGYNVKVTKEESSSDGSKTTEDEKHIPGDTTAMIFWLKNRQPKLWRDKQPEEVGESDGVIHKVQIEVISADKDNGDGASS